MINLSSLNFFSINHLKQNLTFSLTEQQKKVAGIALLAFSCIALAYVCLRCCFQAETIDLDDDDHAPAGGVLNPQQKIAQLLAEADEEAKQFAWDKADAKYQEALKIDPKNIDAISYYARCLFKQGLLDRAAENFEKALNLDPQNVSVLKNYAKTLLKQGKLNEAKTSILKAIRITAESPSTSPSTSTEFTFGDVLCALGDYDEAKNAYLRGLKNLKKTRRGNGYLLRLIHPERGQMPPGKMKIRRHMALFLCRELLKEKKSSDCREFKFITTFAGNLYLFGYYGEAARLYEELISLAPNDSSSDVVNKLISLDTRNNPGSLFRYVHTLVELGRYSEAKNLINEALVYVPNERFILGLGGRLYFEEGKLAKADHFYREILTLEPNDIVALNHHAFILSEQGHFEEAVKNFEKVLAIEPENVYALTHYADVLFKQDEFEEAKDMFEKVLKLKPKTAHALSQLGKIQDVLKAKG